MDEFTLLDMIFMCFWMTFHRVPSDWRDRYTNRTQHEKHMMRERTLIMATVECSGDILVFKWTFFHKVPTKNDKVNPNSTSCSSVRSGLGTFSRLGGHLKSFAKFLGLFFFCFLWCESIRCPAGEPMPLCLVVKCIWVIHLWQVATT